jgi:hypothetical protein
MRKRRTCAEKKLARIGGITMSSNIPRHNAARYRGGVAVRV